MDTTEVFAYESRLAPRAAKEIWEAAGIVDTEIYRQLLESLRGLGILKRSVSSATAHFLAKKSRVPSKNIPQFSIVLPSEIGDSPKQAEIADDVADDADYAKLYVVNVPFETKEADLQKLFGRFGEVVSTTIPMNRETGKSRGFAFVEFDKSEGAVKALAKSGKIKLGGRTLYLQKAESVRKNTHGGNAVKPGATAK